MSTVFRVRPYGQRLQEPRKSWGAGVSSGGIVVEASDTAGGAAAGVLDPTPAEALGRALSSEL